MAGALYVGIDLGKGFHQLAMVDERKERLGEPFRIGRGRSGAELVLKRAKLRGAQPADVVVTIEATGDYWRELVWAFVNAGCRVYLAVTSPVRRVLQPARNIPRSSSSTRFQSRR